MKDLTKLKTSIVYKITDLDSGKFYIGSSVDKERFLDGRYNGSGELWNPYYEDHKHSHTFKREVLFENPSSFEELYRVEVEEILKFCFEKDGEYFVDHSTGCMNKKTTEQNDMHTVCELCGKANAHHDRECPNYNGRYDREPCPECGSVETTHKEGCSKFIRPLSKKICPECGAKRGHYKSCSQYKEPMKCEECGGVYNHHAKNCSKFKPRAACPECGSRSSHKSWCSKFKEVSACPECGKKQGHKKTCSKYKKLKPCPECGGIVGHKNGCSKKVYPKLCPECGAKRGHYKICSKYKETVCPECGVKHGFHLDSCSHSKGKCPECGRSLQSSHHAPTCSKYKPYKVGKTCQECGGKDDKHKKTCSKYKRKEKNV